jgi:hypothetical protein
MSLSSEKRLELISKMPKWLIEEFTVVTLRDHARVTRHKQSSSPLLAALRIRSESPLTEGRERGDGFHDALAGDKAMSQRQSPYRTVGSLVDYASAKIHGVEAVNHG